MILLETVSFKILVGEKVVPNFTCGSLVNNLSNFKCVYVEIEGRPNISLTIISRVVKFIDSILGHHTQYAWKFYKNSSCKENELIVKIFQGGKKC